MNPPTRHTTLTPEQIARAVAPAPLARIGATAEEIARAAARLQRRTILVRNTAATGKTTHMMGAARPEYLPPHRAAPTTLTEDEVRRIRERVAKGEKLAAIAIDLDITVPAVSRIACGLTYANAPGPLTRGHCKAHPNSKLSVDDIAAMRTSRRNGRTFQAIARDFGVPYSTVHRIVTGKVYRADGGAQ